MKRWLFVLLVLALFAAPAEAAKLQYLKGSTSIFVDVFIQDSSSSTGAGLTGLTSGSGGLVCYYARSDQGNAGGTQISLTSATRGTYTSSGFIEKDATNLPGVYELGLPSGVLATGSNYAVVMCKGATNMAPMVLEVQLAGLDIQDAVHAGLSGIPNATPGAAGGMFIAGTNAATTITTALTTTFTGNLTGSVGSCAGCTAASGVVLMPEAAYVKDSTSVIHEIFIKDTTTFLGKTGLTSGSAGLTIAFGRSSQGNAGYSTCAAQAATRGTYTSCGFVEKDATNAPGWYELGLTTAMLATGSDYVNVSIYGATGSAPTDQKIALVDVGLIALNNRLGTPASSSLSADIASVQTGTTAIKAKTDLISASAGNLNAIVNDYATGKFPVQATVAGRTLDVGTSGGAAVDWANIKAPTSSNALTNTTVSSAQTVNGVTAAVGTYRRNVAGQVVFPIYMRDAANAALLKPGLTLAVTISKDGGPFNAATGVATEVGFGHYVFAPSQADTNCGLCDFRITAVGLAIDTGYTIHTAP